MSTQPGPANPAISLSTALEPYVDVKRAASYLSVAVKTLNEWARLEKIPAYPWGDGSRNLALQTQRTRRVDAEEDKLRSSSASFGKDGKT
jgi:hypothetical protein